MGTAERREKDKQQMRTRILETAMKLFLKEGFDRVTIRAIAEAIEYSPGTIYLYFQDKNEILYALQTIGFEKLQKEQRVLLAIKNPWKRLREHGKVYVDFALKNPQYYDLMFIMRGPVEKMKEAEEWEAGQRSYELLKENISECMEAGYLPKANLDVATFATWSFTHGMASLIIRHRASMLPPGQVQKVVEGALDYMMERGIRGK